MVRPSSDRIEAYNTKRVVSMPLAYEAMVKGRVPKTDKIGYRAQVDEKVASILTKNNVSGNDRIKYHNFARYIEKRIREGTLTTTVVEASKSKYIALGCEDAILDEIISALTGAST